MREAAPAAYNSTCACCRLGRIDDALFWWERTVQSGWTNVAAADDDDDLVLIRVLIRASSSFASA